MGLVLQGPSGRAGSWPGLATTQYPARHSFAWFLAESDAHSTWVTVRRGTRSGQWVTSPCAARGPVRRLTPGSEASKEVVERLADEGGAQDVEHGGVMVDVVFVDAVGQYLDIDAGRCRRDTEEHIVDLDGRAV